MENYDAPQFPVVGIGVSADGLEACERLLAHLPLGSGLAFVLIQHPDPPQSSLPLEKLREYTPLPVLQAEEGLELKPDCFYVIPPNRSLILKQNRLHPAEQLEPPGLPLPVDLFFNSLGSELGERAIGVILSGANTDGLIGLKTIKEVGGLVVAQEPASARDRTMPQSAIDTGQVDYILPPEQISGQLIGYARQRFLAWIAQSNRPLLPLSSEQIQRISSLLLAQTGHDFSGYKERIFQRRLERRLALHNLHRLEDYLALLEQSPAEVEALFKELLISVTRFFRDPEAFAALEEQVVLRLFTGRPPGKPVRVWVPGCATGEEIYSLAVLLWEQMEGQPESYPIQIFGTDIDEDAIKKARQATYPLNIASQVSPERLNRFFRPRDGKYQVDEKIRDSVVLVKHNLLQAPPFSQLDLISCRNLLIYLEAEPQQKILSLFHHALNPEGYLFLGTSEGVYELPLLFRAIDPIHKIFQSTSARPDLQMVLSSSHENSSSNRKRETDANLRRRYAHLEEPAEQGQHPLLADQEDDLQDQRLSS